MNWLNLPISVLRSDKFLGAEPVDRATWIALMTFCAVQENGGWIFGCDEWGERKWQQLVGITKEEALRVCDLWKWDTGSLFVWAYPKDKEHEVREKRKAAKDGGTKTSPAKAAAARENGAKGGRPGTKPEQLTEPKQEPNLNPSNNPTEENRREENRREKEPAAPPVFVSLAGHQQGQAEKLKALHAEFERLTDQKCSLNYQREMTWAEFAKRGFTADDLSQVIRWLKLKIARGEGGYSAASLKFSTLLQDLNKFEDNLNVARKVKLPPERAASGPLKEPPGWRAWAAAKYPQATLPPSFWRLDDSVQREFRQENPALGWKGANYIGAAA